MQVTAFSCYVFEEIVWCYLLAFSFRLLAFSFHLYQDTAPERRYSSHTFRYGYLVTT